jgi:MFS family permease
VVIDRIQKRNLIMITQSIVIAINLTIAILITLGHIQYWHLLIASFASGANNAFNMPARNSIVVELVPREKLFNAIALNNGASNIARIAGPALAGVLIGFIGTQGAYYVGIAFNAIAIFTIGFLPPTSKLGFAAQKSALSNIKDGFAYLKIHNIILILLGLEIALTLFGMSYQGLMPVFANLLQADPEKYGLMMSAVGIGSLTGALSIATLGSFKHKGLVMVCTGVVFGVMLVLFGNTIHIGEFFGFPQNAYYLALVSLVIVGMASTSYTASSLTIIQMSISDEYRGRVTSIYQIVIALYPLSIVMSSAVAEVIGAPLALTIGGGCLTVFMLSILFFVKRVRRLE